MKGFTLLETTVAIAVLIVGILGPLSMATFTLSRSSLSENEIVAYNLAVEALEFVINTRDTNIFEGDNWLDGLDESANNCDHSDGCYIDVTETNLANQVRQCATPTTCPFIKRDASSGLYNYSTGSDTIFRRRIYLDNNDLDNNDERIVRVTVTWNEKFAANKSIVIEHHIFERE